MRERRSTKPLLWEGNPYFSYPHVYYTLDDFRKNITKNRRQKYTTYIIRLHCIRVDDILL